MQGKIKQYIKNHKRILNFVLSNQRHLLRMRSLIVDRQLLKSYFVSHEIRKLQIGSGKTVIQGWLNTDINPRKEIAFLDASKKLPFKDCTFDYILSEHLIEHISYQDGLNLIMECYRILKPGGKIRISTPDLRFLIELYSENRTDLQERYIRWAVDNFLPDSRIYRNTFVINNFFQNFGHKFIYDFKTLNESLQGGGFKNIRCYNVGESDDDNLKGIESHDQYLTKAFNELESIVLEGTKPI